MNAEKAWDEKGLTSIFYFVSRKLIFYTLLRHLNEWGKVKPIRLSGGIIIRRVMECITKDFLIYLFFFIIW